MSQIEKVELLSFVNFHTRANSETLWMNAEIKFMRRLGQFNPNQNFSIINLHRALLQTGNNRDKFSSVIQSPHRNWTQ